MENLKMKGLFTLLFTLTIFLTLAFGNVFATEIPAGATPEYVPIYVKIQNAKGTTLKKGTVYKDIKPGDVLTATAYTDHEKSIYWSNENSYFMSSKGFKPNDKGMAILAYKFDNESTANAVISDDPTKMDITIPDKFEPGSTHLLRVQGVGAIDKLLQNGIYYIATSGWQDIEFTIPKNEPLTGTISVARNNKTLAVGSMTVIEEGEKVSLKTNPAENFSEINGSWTIGSANTKFTIAGEDLPYTLEIPGEEGQTIILKVSGVLKDDGKVAEQKYIFDIPKVEIEPEPLTGNLSAKVDNKELPTNKTNEMEVGEEIALAGTPAENFEKLMYKWDDGAEKEITGAKGNIKVPEFEPGSEHTLTITGKLKDGTITSKKVYKIKIPKVEEKPVESEKLTGNVNAKLDDKTLNNNSTNNVLGYEEITVNGSPTENFANIVYSWDDGEENKVTGNEATIEVEAEVGKKHKLEIYGVLTDGGKTSTKTYYFTIPEEEELIIEPWMREDTDAEGVLVSLRNDTEIDKANKNFYMLEEEVIYYVDYKNCGNDITDEMELILKLPLDFEVVDADNGKVSTKNNTITWSFENGLEEEQAGTKEVIIKYTELSKSSYEYEIVYPQASIYEASKKIDTSTVINYIYIDESTVIEDEHDPYMFGDKEKPTFRPDDTISRAEGALVLTRIFGINTSTTKVTDKFSDINETYLEAQKAITAASKLGIIDGYKDGTYRPKEKMTRAEFMKIIASYIEVIGEDEDIEGLEVREETNIKVYKNSSNRNHWAIPYVTLLTRLNMTPAHLGKRDLRLNDEITRAEVAQFINFYSFRAPAKISTSTKLDFSDVSRNHDLFEDIVEATRETHKYTITDNGKEKAK